MYRPRGRITPSQNGECAYELVPPRRAFNLGQKISNKVRIDVKKENLLDGNVVPVLVTSSVEFSKTQTLCQNTCEIELVVNTRKLEHFCIP